MTRNTMQLTIFVVVTASCLATEATAQQIETSPYRQVQPVHLSEVTWTDGFWRQRYVTCRDKMVPTMWEIMTGAKYKPVLEHFRIAAGMSEGDYHGAKWNDGDFYKWMEAVCALQAVERDPGWDQRLDEIIAIIGKAQRPDGYIHTPVLVDLAYALRSVTLAPLPKAALAALVIVPAVFPAACLVRSLPCASEVL